MVVDGLTAASVSASYANVTLGPGNVNFTPSGTGVTVTNNVSGTSTPNPCGADRFPTFCAGAQVSASLRYFCGPRPNFLIQRQTAARCLPSSRETSATLPS